MIVEQRTYTFFPGNVPVFLSLYEEEGLPVQRLYLKRMLGYYITEVGPLNQLIHLWGYESFEERLEARQKMRADVDFQRYWQKVKPLIQRQETRILLPAKVFEDRLTHFVNLIDSDQP